MDSSFGPSRQRLESKGGGDQETVHSLEESSGQDSAVAEFRDKYELLRAAYEQRILHLSRTVRDVCGEIVSSEVISELRKDAISSAFIPGHITEVLSAHLHTERESFVHETIEKLSETELRLRAKENTLHDCMTRISELETSLNESNQMIHLFQPMSDELRAIKEEYEFMRDSSNEEASSLRGATEELEEKVRQLSQQLDFKTAECSLLETQLRETAKQKVNRGGSNQDIAIEARHPGLKSKGL